MKYITFNSKEYLEDLVKDKDVFISVFEETLGYSLKKCIELEVVVPLDLVRSIPNYMRYPNMIDFFKGNYTAYEVGSVIENNKIEFNKDLFFTKSFIEGLKSSKNGNNILGSMTKLLDKYPLDKKLSFDEFILWQEAIYSNLYANIDSLDSNNANYNMVKLSLRQMTKEELLKVDFSFATMGDFIKIFEEKGIDFKEMDDLHNISRAAIYLNKKITEDPQKLSQFYVNFQDENVFNLIPFNIWLKDEKRVSYLTDFANGVASKTSIRNNNSFFSRFAGNINFYNAITTLKEDSVILNTNDGKQLKVKDFWMAVNISSFQVKEMFKEYFNVVYNRNILTQEDLNNVTFDVPSVSGAFKLFRYLEFNDVVLLNKQEIESFLETTPDKEWENNVNAFIRLQVKKSIEENNLDVLDELAKVITKNLLIDGTNYISEILNINNGEFAVRAIKHMPISINKALMARSVLKHYKEKENQDVLSIEQIECLKSFMSVPEHIKAPLNRYVNSLDSSFSQFTKEDLNILLSYGDPSFNQVKYYSNWKKLENKENIKKMENESNVFENTKNFMSEFSKFIVDSDSALFDKDYIDKADDLINSCYKHIDNLNKIVSLELSPDKIISYVAYSLKSVLMCFSDTNPLVNNMDGKYYPSPFNKDEYIENESPIYLARELQIQAYLIMLDLSLATLSSYINENPTENSKMIERIEGLANLKDSDYKKMSLINPHLNEINSFNIINDDNYKMVFAALLKNEILNNKEKMSDLIDSCSLRSDYSNLIRHRNDLGEEFFNALLDKKPNVATILRLDPDEYHSGLLIAKNWEQLGVFIKKCFDAEPIENVFVAGDKLSKENIYNENLIPSSIALLGLEDLDNHPFNFFNLLEDIKISPISYVCLLSKENIYKFYSENKTYCIKNNLDAEEILNKYLDINVYADGVVDLFERRLKFIEDISATANINLEKNPFLQNIFLANSIKTIKDLPRKKKDDFFEILVTKAKTSECKAFVSLMKDKFFKNLFEHDENDWANSIRNRQSDYIDFERVEFDLLSSIVASCKKENIELDNFETKIDFLNYLVNAKNQNNLLEDYKKALNREITVPVLEIIDVLNKDLIIKKTFSMNNNDYTQEGSEFKI